MFFQSVQSGSGYLVGDCLTYVDLTVSEHVEGFRVLIPGFLDGFPELLEHAKKVRSNEKLAKWIETRPKSDY